MTLRTVEQFRETFNPSNWTVTSNNGSGLLAKNSASGETFEGSAAEFKVYLDRSFRDTLDLLVDEDGTFVGYRTKTSDILFASGSSSAGLSSAVYDGSNRITQFVLNSVTYTVSGWGTSTITIAGSDGTSRVMTLDGSGRITGVI